MPTTPTEQVAANIRAELARRGLSQADLSLAIGVSQPGVSKRLRGVTALTINELTAIARLLEVPMDTLLAGVEPEPAAS